MAHCGRCHRRWLAHADDTRDLQRVAGAPAEQLPEGHASCPRDEIVQRDVEGGLGRRRSFDPGVERAERRLAVSGIAADEGGGQITPQGFGRSAPRLTRDIRIGRRFAPTLRAVTRADADQDTQGIRVAGVGNDEGLAQRQADRDNLDGRDDHGAHRLT